MQVHALFPSRTRLHKQPQLPATRYNMEFLGSGEVISDLAAAGRALVSMNGGPPQPVLLRMGRISLESLCILAAVKSLESAPTFAVKDYSAQVSRGTRPRKLSTSRQTAFRLQDFGLVWSTMWFPWALRVRSSSLLSPRPCLHVRHGTAAAGMHRSTLGLCWTAVFLAFGLVVYAADVCLYAVLRGRIGRT